MNTIKINTKNKLFPTGDLWGIFFEDINHAADGGLYPEMVQNRAFAFCAVDNPEYHALTAWEIRGEGDVTVEYEDGINDANTHYTVIKTDGETAVVNAGFGEGLSYEKGEKYNYSLYLKGNAQKVTVSFEDLEGNAYYSEDIGITDKWEKYTGSFIAPETDYKGRAAVTVTNGEARVTMVSVMPEKTFKNHGLRVDLAEKLAALKPKFMRFPGGCLVHDGSLDKNDRNSLYRWVNTIGAVEERPPRRNNWGYNQTAGLGYFEYFRFCEDIGAKAIPVVSGGWNPHAHTGVEIEDIGEFVDETLALIEFANGDETTEWGKKRAEMGHAAPFNLEYIAVGNEEVAGGFFDRYPYFHKAIREKYPEIKIIATSGPWCDGYDFDYGWAEAKKWGADIVDEHYYMHPEWFLTNINRYASYDRNDPKVFIGEFASWGNKYRNALAEACYMTAVENNADVVSLACYAPLFANVDYVNWSPDMIWFDNHRSYGTPNYYVQQMFMANQPENVVEIKTESDIEKEPMELREITGRVGISVSKTAAEFYDISVNGKENPEVYAATNVKWQANDGKCTFDEICQIPVALFFEPLCDETVYRLKAKKTAGREGFRIVFGAKNSKDYYFWEIGGWNNDVSMVNKMQGDKSAGVTVGRHVTVETGREYEIEIEAKGNHFICRLDGEVFHDFEEKRGEILPIYCTAGVSGDTTILKAANYREAEYTAQIALDKAASKVRVTELVSEDLTAENSLDEPEKIAPVTREFDVNGDTFEYTFPGYSVTVLEIE